MLMRNLSESFALTGTLHFSAQCGRWGIKLNSRVVLLFQKAEKARKNGGKVLARVLSDEGVKLAKDEAFHTRVVAG